MKRAALILLAACTSASANPPPSSASWDDYPPVQFASLPRPQVTIVSAHFSPRGGCTDDVVSLISRAGAHVILAGYSFTSGPIADELVYKAKAGVRVEAVLDRSDAGDHPVHGSKAKALQAGGVVVHIDRKHAIFHDKYIVVDGTFVETGSFNYTAAAEQANAENCLILRSPELARTYSEDWAKHAEHSRRL